MYPFQDLTHEIISSAIEVHKMLGPGLLESVYRLCLQLEFDHRKIQYRKELDIPLVYRDQKIERAFRIDFLIENEIILELKSSEGILPVHEAQLLTYLKLSGKQIGLLINFNVSLLKNGIRRCILTRNKSVYTEFEMRRSDAENGTKDRCPLSERSKLAERSNILE